MTNSLSPILIIDDEKDNLEALNRLLRTHFKVTTLLSPFEALKRIQAETFHVIVSDQRMPEMTGVELLEKAKKLKPDATRILLTGYTDVVSVIDSINRGSIYRYISKPWDPEDLKLTLRQADEAFLLKKALTEKNRDLEKALEELKLLDRAKAKFLSLVSHELNTPLTVLNSFVELLSEKKTEFSMDIQRSVSSIKNASARFAEIVQEVLTYTKLEADQSLSLSKIDLQEELKDAFDKNAKLSAEKAIRLTFEKSGKGTVDLDPTKIRIVLEKLVADTLERAPKGSEVSIQSTASGFTLRRKGEKLPSEAFNVLVTAQDQMHHHKNLGLRLATVKLICEAHHGTIESSEDGDWQQISVHFGTQLSA